MNALDGVRGLAILLVTQFHFYGLPYGLTGRRPELAVDRMFLKVAGTGWIGVDLFFVLSGFLITGILSSSKGSTFYFRNFYARRFLRIFPLYYGALIIALVLLPMVPTLDRSIDITELRGDQIWYWLYLPNVWRSFASLDAHPHVAYWHLWSLAVEEQFYLIWPLVVFALNRRRLLLACGASIAIAFAVRCAIIAFGDAVFTDVAPRLLMPARLDSFATGAAIALLIQTTDGLEIVRRWTPRAAVAGATVLIAIFLIARGLPANRNLIDIWGLLAAATLFGAVIAVAAAHSPGALMNRALAHPALTLLGRRSYAVYLFHVPLAFVVAERVIAFDFLPTVYGSQIPGSIAFNVVCTVLALALSWLSWVLIEERCLSLKRYVPSRSTGHVSATFGSIDPGAQRP